MFKVDFELLYKELDELDITVYDYPFETCNAMTVFVNEKYYIGINSTKNFSKYMKFWLVQHELEHIKHGTLYHTTDDRFTINRNERITNDAVILKLGLIPPVISCLIKGLDKWEICDSLEIPYEIYDCCIDYINRRGLSNMKNAVELLCHKNGYDALVLSKRLGCTEQEAQDIMDEKVCIKYEYILRLCQIFQVSQEYLLCM